MHDFSCLVVGSALRRVIDLWPEVQSILAISRMDSIGFTDRFLLFEKIQIYIVDESIGLYKPVADQHRVSLIVKIGTSDFAHDPSLDPSWMAECRILPTDYQKVITAAELIVGRVSEPTSNTAFLDPKHPRYAPKLAAAVRAWEAVTDAGGKHPKQALAQWLREHAADFRMTDEEGRPNETGIEEVAKVANWRPSGGAPKTPGE